MDELTPRSRYSAIRGQLAPLPNTNDECHWVAEHFNPAGLATGIFLKGQATEQAVRANLAGRRVIHLACHGLTDQTHGNLFGALALTPGSGAQNAADDGFLTLAEIYGLDMKGCELAILSACETNLGPQQHGEGVFALSRGFLVAGARRVVASNWIVDDQSSASLVSVFCSLLAKQHKAGQPMDHAAALHEAKRWVRKQEKWKHPYYWGAFLLVGPG
jgi:CHAT domain-containing protein